MAYEDKTIFDIEATEIGNNEVAPNQFTTKSSEKWWIWEFVALFVSLLALFAIVILLVFYQDHPSPYSLIGKKVRWSFRGYEGEVGVHFSINAYISIFSTIFKTSLAVPVAAALSQLKWTWFRRDRPLSDYALIDKATRGTTGSLMLMWKLRGKHLASMGAFLTVAALVLDFAFQSLVQYPLLSLIISGATLPRTQGYSSIANHGNLGGLQVSTDMLTAMISGLYNFNTTDDSRSVTPNCVTGNCSWPDYTSLAVCSQCADVTPQVLQNCSTTNVGIVGDNSTRFYCNYTLPDNSSGYPDLVNGLFISGLYDIYGSGPTAVNLSVAQALEPSFGSLQSVFSILNVLQGNWNDDSILVSVNATQCALSYCVNRYSGRVVNNTFEEEVTDIFFNQTFYNTTSESGDYLPFVIKPDGNFTKGIVNVTEEYAVSYQAWMAMGLKLGKVWTGYAVRGNSKGLDSSDAATVIAPLGYEAIVNATGSLAESMTTAMRKAGDEQDVSGSNADPRVRIVYGDTSQYVPYVVVEWRWMVLSAFMLVLTLVFLLLTMKNHKGQDDILWKDTSLAVFYQPLTGDGRDELQSAQNKNHLGEIADNLKVRWTQTEKGWRLAKARDS